MRGKNELPPTQQCAYCGAAMPGFGYIGEETCPGCRLVWEYDEGDTPTIKSLRELVARAVAEATTPAAWTTDTPTAPGWYWCRWPDAPGDVEAVEVTRSALGTLWVNGNRLGEYAGREWCPIPPPPE